jgi:hypothetical protein
MQRMGHSDFCRKSSERAIKTEQITSSRVVKPDGSLYRRLKRIFKICAE